MRKMITSIATILAVSALMVGVASAADKLVVKDSAGTSNVFAVDDTGITTITNKTAADTNSVLNVKNLVGESTLTYSPNGILYIGTTNSQLAQQAYVGDSLGSLPNARPNVALTRHRGTSTSKLPVMLNDKLGTFAFGGWDGSAIQTGALLESFVDGPVVAGSAVPSRLSIVTGSSQATRAERLIVKADGKVGIGTASPATVLHSTGSTILGAANAAVADSSLGAGQCNIWLDESANQIIFKCKYTNGTTVKSATVPLN